MEVFRGARSYDLSSPFARTGGPKTAHIRTITQRTAIEENGTPKFGETSKSKLTLGELEPLASALLTVLLALMLARVTGQKACRLQLAAQLRIELDQSARDAEPGCSRLAGDTAAIGQDQNIEAVRHFGEQQGLANVGAGRFVRKVIVKWPVVDRDLAFTGTQEHTRGGGFAAAGC